MAVVANGRAFNNYRIKNLSNNKAAFLVDTQSIESTYTEEFNSNEDGTDIIEPSAGNRIIVKDVFFAINDPGVGEVKLDFSGNGDKIARLYGSQFSRAGFTNLTKAGGNDEKVQLTADASGNKLYVLINYIEVAGD